MRYISSSISFLGKLYRYWYSKKNISAAGIGDPIISISLHVSCNCTYVCLMQAAITHTHTHTHACMHTQINKQTDKQTYRQTYHGLVWPWPSCPWLGLPKVNTSPLCSKTTKYKTTFISTVQLITKVNKNKHHIQWNLLIRTLENKDTCIIHIPSYDPKWYKLTWKIRTPW